MAFAVNVPNARLVDANGNVTPEWYRFFARIQRAIGSSDNPLDFGSFLTLADSPGLGADRVFTPAPGQLVGTDGGANSTYTLGLADTAVVAAPYGGASKTVSFTVDAKGRLVAAAEFALSTTNITEGTNLYYTDARARAALSQGTGIAYNSGTGVIAIDSGVVVTLTGIQTITNKTLTAPVISGGTIDNAVIGGTTRAAGSFTTLDANGNVTLGDAAADSLTLNIGPVTAPNATTWVIGHTASITGGKVQVVGSGDNIHMLRFSADAGASQFNQYKSRSGTVGTNTVVQSGDTLGQLNFFGADGTNYIRAAQIDAIVDGTPGTNDMPGALKFRTTSDGASSVTERWKLGSTGFFSATSGSIGRAAPVTKTADFTVADNENWLINNKAGSTCTMTLPSASTYSGREIMIKTIQAQTVVSASSNVVPLAGGAAGTAILAATAGKYAVLVSDGTNWIISQAN